MTTDPDAPTGLLAHPLPALGLVLLVLGQRAAWYSPALARSVPVRVGSA